MTSNPIGRCCTVGVKHEGTAVGEFKKFGDVRAYFSYPKDKSTENAVIVLTDIIGADFINIKLIADQFAANGYFAVIPDLFNGAEADFNNPNFDLQHYIQHVVPREPTVDPIIEKTLKHLKGELGVKRLGAAGYCFGGKFVIRFLKEGQLDAGYTAHPSFVTKEELEAIQKPLSISAAEIDDIFPAEKRHESEDILEKIKATYQLNLFSGVSHGFGVRCDLSVKQQKFAKEQAFLQAVAWFDEHVKQ